MRTKLQNLAEKFNRNGMPETSASNRFLGAGLQNSFAASFLFLIFSFTSGCVAQTPELINHSLVIRNKSSNLIKDVVIVYGSERIVFEGGYVRGGGRGYMGQMAISPQLVVEWKTQDNESHRQVLPVRLKNASPRQLDALKIEFAEDGLELYQGIVADKYSSDYTRIFP
jgi:hypothetical protein